MKKFKLKKWQRNLRFFRQSLRSLRGRRSIFQKVFFDTDYNINSFFSIILLPTFWINRGAYLVPSIIFLPSNLVYGPLKLNLLKKINLNHSQSIVAANICNYLLERSRLTSQSSEERNFHIFYMMMKGLSDEERRTKYLLDLPMEQLNYLNSSKCYRVENLDE